MLALTEVAAGDAIKQRLGPALERFDDKVRQGKRAIVRAQHAAEDGVGATVVKIRRHPLRAITLAAGVGAFVGTLFGLVCSRWIPRGEA